MLNDQSFHLCSNLRVLDAILCSNARTHARARRGYPNERVKDVSIRHGAEAGYLGLRDARLSFIGSGFSSAGCPPHRIQSDERIV